MTFFITETSPDGRYFVKISDSCFTKYFSNTPIKTTWNVLYARIFGLSFPDFLRMARDVYGATLVGKTGLPYFYFTYKQDCDRLVKDLTNRFTMWMRTSI
jgi:hypothetical protein